MVGQTSTATRFLYQPQLGHTTWGSLADPHRGQSERAGSESRHAPARWLRAFDFDRFFLGTAIVRNLSWEQLGPGLRRRAMQPRP